jgi:hypothetical protein
MAARLVHAKKAELSTQVTLSGIVILARLERIAPEAGNRQASNGIWDDHLPVRADIPLDRDRPVIDLVFVVLPAQWEGQNQPDQGHRRTK